ncbi:MAG: carboxypeptidase regulatory-like domain-containing protein [Fibrobacteraceae bacterium]|nr:carboxypeptidase regulatory-like domain-containing protein [Fibrobacteraceae bacterium]
MKSKLIFSPLVLGLFLFASIPIVGCSESKTANGTGSNAGETELATIQVAYDNKPLSGGVARLWIMTNDSLELEKQDSIGADGSVAIDTKDSSVHMLEASKLVDGENVSVMQWLDYKKALPESVVASKTEELKGRIISDGKGVANADIRILDVTVTTDDDGYFTFKGLPSGVHYGFVRTSDSTKSFQLQTGAEVKANTADISDVNFTLVENFEKWNRRQTILGKTFGNGSWFICTDQLEGGNSTSSGDLGTKSIIVSDSSAYDGNSFHVSFKIDEEFEGAYGTAGFNLGDDYNNHSSFALFDLSVIDAFTFYAKGEGTIYLQLTVFGDLQNKRFLSVPIELTESWTKYSVTADDFRNNNEDFLEKDLHAVNSVNFVAARGEVDLYLDNIRFEGISPAVWPNLGFNY